MCAPGENHDYEGNTYDRATAKGWKEFYYPTMVNPEWDTDMENELRKSYTQVGYEHEIMAEFGTEMIGVFNKEFVDEACSKDYPLQLHRTHPAPIAIGVDWDKFGAATQIVVTQYNPNDPRRIDEEFRGMGRFTVINRIEIPKGEFTYDNAVKKIIELTAIYDPAFIYADRGSGEYQIELLRKALGDIVHGIHLGASHMVRDPYSREMDKKPIKPFMVNQATLMLERGQLRIPHRDTDEVIYRQMTNYQVLRVSPKTGEPTYNSDDEHALDAMMLCLLGFIIEMPELAKTIEAIEVARSMGYVKTRFHDPVRDMFQADTTRDSMPSYIKDWDEIGAPPPRKVGLGYKAQRKTESMGWARGSNKGSTPSRRSW
jgi:replicative DNA helicase